MVSEEPKELSREEMIKRLKEIFDEEADIFSAIPGLAVKEIDGKKVYEYNGKKLEDLDKDALTKLFIDSNRFIKIQNMKNLERQMELMKQIDNMNRVQRSLTQATPPNVPKAPTGVSGSYAPPSVPKAPSSVSRPSSPPRTR